MIEAWCNSCGARFRVEDALAGRKARCGRCKAVVDVPEANPFMKSDAAVPLADENDPFANLPLEAETLIEDDDAPDAPVVLESAARPDYIDSIRRGRRIDDEENRRSLWNRLPGCFLFLLRGMNLYTFLLLWFFATLLLNMSFFAVSVFTVFAVVAICGTGLSMMFAVLLDSAGEADSDRLVDMLRPGDAGELVRSGLMMLFSLAWSLLPAGLLWLVLLATVVPAGYPEYQILALLAIPVCLVLLWPMTMLVMALYGFDMRLLLYHTAVINIGRTLKDYSAVALSVLVCAGLMMLSWHLRNKLSITSSSLHGGLGMTLLGMAGLGLLRMYCYFTMMRIIGVYYRCNRLKFTWEP